MCASCHGELYDSYQSHGMAQSFYPLTAEVAVEDFSGVEVAHAPTGFVYVARREGDRFVQEEYRRDETGEVSHRLVRSMDYVVGSGSAARTYLSEENGRLYELPLTWYTQPVAPGQGTTVGPADAGGGHWALSPGYAESNGRFDPPHPRAVHGVPQRDQPRRPLRRREVRRAGRRHRVRAVPRAGQRPHRGADGPTRRPRTRWT